MNTPKNYKEEIIHYIGLNAIILSSMYLIVHNPFLKISSKKLIKEIKISKKYEYNEKDLYDDIYVIKNQDPNYIIKDLEGKIVLE